MIGRQTPGNPGITPGSTPGISPGITPRQTGLGPQKRLFIILCIAMAVWICALVTMYFTTVWPERHGGMPVQRENDVDDHQPTTLQG